MIVKPYQILEDELQSKPFDGGSLYLTKDTNRLYIDFIGGQSHTLISADPIILSTESERENILAPIPNKLYIVLDTKSIYIYNDSKWYNFASTSSNSAFSNIKIGDKIIRASVDTTLELDSNTIELIPDIENNSIILNINQATTSINGLMSTSDKKIVNAVSGSTNLGDISGKTITQLRSDLDAWLNNCHYIPSATTFFCANAHWIDLWNTENISTIINAGPLWTVSIVGIYDTNADYIQLRISSYNKYILYAYKSNGTWGPIRTTAFTDDLYYKTNKRDADGGSYNHLASLHVGSTNPIYYRVTIPSSTNSVYTMITMELSLRANYSNETGGKILINAHHSSSSTTWSINATVLGYLPYTVKVYASDNYFYIEGGAAWGTISVDKMLIGDNAIYTDFSNTSIDVVTELPSSYQTATMYYGLHSGNYTSHISPSAIGAAAASHGNHVPAIQTASNSKFLRNDNTWQTVTPANIGAAASSHTHNVLSVQSENYKQGTDLPSTYPQGQTIFFSNNPTNRFNGVQYCTIHTIKGYTNMACIQFLYPYNTNHDTIYYRTATYNSNTWRSWNTISTLSLDTALTSSGKAADAKATGDAINALRNEILGGSW